MRLLAGRLAEEVLPNQRIEVPQVKGIAIHLLSQLLGLVSVWKGRLRAGQVRSRPALGLPADAAAGRTALGNETLQQHAVGTEKTWNGLGFLQTIDLTPQELRRSLAAHSLEDVADEEPTSVAEARCGLTSNERERVTGTGGGWLRAGTAAQLAGWLAGLLAESKSQMPDAMNELV